jgi:hypothetical protein
LCATLHGVVRKTRAVVGTALADFRTDAAGERMQIRTSDHEIRACLAYLRAIQHQPGVILFDMLPTHGKTVLCQRFQTNPVTVETLFDTRLHPGIHRCNSLLRVLQRFQKAEADRKPAC